MFRFMNKSSAKPVSKPWSIWLALAMIVLAWLGTALLAQADELQDAKVQLHKLDAALGDVTDQLAEKKKLTDVQLVALLNQTRDIRAQQLDLSQQLTEAQDQVTQALQDAKPADGTNVDAKAQTLVTKKLQDQQAERQGLLVQLNLSITKSENVLQQISDRRKDVYYSTITARSASPLTPKAIGAMKALVVQDASALWKWVKTNTEKTPKWDLALRILAVLAYVLLLPGVMARWCLGVESGVFSAPWAQRQLARMEREFVWLVSAGQVVFRMLVFSALAVLVYVLSRLTGLVDNSVNNLMLAIYGAMAGLALVDVVSVAVLSPGNPEWRLVEMADAKAKRARIFTLLAFSLFAFSAITRAIYTHSGMLMPLESLQAQSAILTFFAALFVLLALIEMPLFSRWTRRLAGKDAKPLERPFGEQALRVVARMTLVALIGFGVIALLAGYIQLGRTLIWVVGLGMMTIATYLLMRRGAFAANKMVSSLLRHPKAGADSAEEEGGAVLNIWLVLFLDILLLVGAVWAFLELGNIRLSDVELWLSRFAEGIKLGEITIDPNKLGSGMVSFFLVILVFRLLQFYLRGIMANNPAYAEGAGASIRALVGYLGVIVAVFVGFSALGLSLSNITLIVSALSVGIGLGLQGIVNNIFSGIILLFERSLKIGDWVVTTADQGTIKKIGLRATELETFDQATVFIPNSDLVTSPMKNWTHGSRSGRVRIAVGVAYDSDPEAVRNILLDVVHAYKLALKRPEPMVYWQAFGESSLDFELRFYLRDITRVLVAETEMRMEIFKALKAAGITIPFPQRDVHLIRDDKPVSAPASTSKPGRKSTKGSAAGGEGPDG